jgi:exodeoxyribonuclease VII large subunit
VIENRERDYPVRTVREFTAGFSEYLDRLPWLRRIGIEGEVSGLRTFGDGHLGFSLKEDRAIVECIAWADARRMLAEFKNGDVVIAVGRVRIYPERGGFRLYAESIELVGLGELYRLYDSLKTRFAAEGLFAPERKRQVPELIRRVALVTAQDGRGAHDFLKTLRDEVPFVEVVVIETRVQGDGAEIDIAAALDRAAALGGDAVVLARGGGSYVELFPFNLEPVVRAIVRSRVPVLTAIGHEPDRHLADEVADLSFGTPSKAAAFIARAWLVARASLNQRTRDLDRAVREILLRHFHWVDARSNDAERAALRVLAAKRAAFGAMSTRLERQSPQRVLAEFRDRTLRLEGRLDASAQRRLAGATRALDERANALERVALRVAGGATVRLERAFAALAACDPLAPLTRGYAIVSAGGRAVRDASTLRPGDAILARLERGTLAARVEAVNDDG